MKEGEKKEEGALLCPLSLERVRGSFYASVARLEGIFSPSSDPSPTVKNEFLLLLLLRWRQLSSLSGEKL